MRATQFLQEEGHLDGHREMVFVDIFIQPAWWKRWLALQSGGKNNRDAKHGDKAKGGGRKEEGKFFRWGELKWRK